ncbi:MAG: mannose-1-phosphate guanylyltransferase [Pirellulaceae bacterium]|nr:mannose-1-phosphate guanylyltransferase [Pirellulaceae bacterium]
MLHAVIMAGGAGTRFWPASRAGFPKQLLDLSGERTMIQSTVDRLGDLVGNDRVLIVTNEQLVTAIREQLPHLPDAAVLGEPCKRDTAPCIGVAAALLVKADPDAVMIVMPSDHVIQPPQQFQSAIRQAVALVAVDERRIVTLGIPPTYPAESFGYIERGEPLEQTCGESAAFEVVRFREKPAAVVAQQYVESELFYWNSGIFIWKAATILDSLREYEPELMERVQAIADAAGRDDFDDVFQREFTEIRGKSIDYAVMEHYEHVVVVEAPFQWDDLGSWGAMARLRDADEDGNTLQGRVVAMDSKNCIIRTNDEHLVATVGIEDCIVVRTADATLVAHRSDEEAIRNLVQQLKERQWDDYL